MFYGWIIVVVTALTLFFSFGYNVSIGAFLGSFSSEFGSSFTVLSLAVSLNMLVWGFLQPTMGKLADQKGPKKVALIGVLVMGVSMILCSTIQSIWQLFLYYGVLTAVGFSASGSLVNSVLIARWFNKKKGTAMGFSTAGINVGQMVVLLFVGYFLSTYNWRFTFLLMGIAMLIVALPIILFFSKNDPKEIGQNQDGEAETIQRANRAQGIPLSEAIRTRDFWLMTLSFMGCGFTLYLIVAHLPNFARELGASKQLAASLLGFAGGASIFGTVLMGNLSDRIGQRLPLLLTHLVRAIAFLILFFASTVTTIQWDILLYGFASFAIIPLVTSYAVERFGPAHIGSIMGVVWMFHQVSAALGVFFGGYVKDLTGSYHLIYLIGFIILLVSSLFTVPLSSKKRDTRVKKQSKSVAT